MDYGEWGWAGSRGWTDELVYLVSVGGWVRVCEMVFSVGFGPGLD